MTFLGVDIDVLNSPPLDPGSLPLGQFNKAFLKSARVPFHIAPERSDGQMAACHTFIHGTPDRFDADVYYIERTVKTMLWMKGGFRLFLAGNEAVCSAIEKLYSDGGRQDFDVFHGGAMTASLFLKVPRELYDRKVKDIYIRAVRDTFGDVPFAVINDGDVSALAGTMSLGEANV